MTPKKSAKKPERRESQLDWSEYSGAVVTCPHCQWHEQHEERTAAWYALARHLKVGHGDFQAAKNAARNLQRIKQKSSK